MQNTFFFKKKDKGEKENCIITINWILCAMKQRFKLCDLRSSIGIDLFYTYY